MILFYLKETLRSINKAKLSSFFSLITTCISIVLILVSFLSLIFSSVIESKLKERVIINVFIKEKINSERINAIIKEVKDFEFVKSVRYISKDEAESNFIQQAGEDFRKILEYNPLPASLEVSVHPQFVTTSLKEITGNFEKIQGIDEVFYHNEFVYNLIKSFSSIRIYLFTAAFFITIISFYLVYSTNRIIMHSRLPHIETMKLVGAKLSSIKYPIILNGILIGVTSSFLTILAVFFIFKMAANYYPKNITAYFDNLIIPVIVFLAGPIIGAAGSYFAARKISLRINKFKL